ncbi:MAG: HNH endonuclease [SAR202 cluster bacterium]|nr:HNH endonuclease [SAR202 cluster bacterium]|tara:strand:+ start:145 stop:408 length:264 start_codon:yes stop_codon:yes gene_type:complete
MIWDEPQQRQKFSKQDKEIILDYQRYKCMYCGVSLKRNSAAQVHFDHKRSLVKGGKDTRSNLQALCSKCNQRKSKTSDVDFRKNIKN